MREDRRKRETCTFFFLSASPSTFCTSSCFLAAFRRRRLSRRSGPSPVLLQSSAPSLPSPARFVRSHLFMPPPRRFRRTLTAFLLLLVLVPALAKNISTVDIPQGGRASLTHYYFPPGTIGAYVPVPLCSSEHPDVFSRTQMRLFVELDRFSHSSAQPGGIRFVDGLWQGLWTVLQPHTTRDDHGDSNLAVE
jgi:hypothetical protein